MPRTESKRENYWAQVWSQYRKNRTALASLLLFAVLSLLSILAPVLSNDRPVLLRKDGRLYFPAIVDYPEFRTVRFRDNREQWKDAFYIMPPLPYSPNEYDLNQVLLSPKDAGTFGTDNRGRNVLARMIYGLRLSLWFAALVVAVSCAAGVFAGAVMGYYGGWTDVLGQRFLEVMILFPRFFLMLAALAYLPQSVWILIAVFVLFGWMGYTRYARAEFLKIRQLDFVQAARACGAGDLRIVARHILPNALGPILVLIPFDVASSILSLSVLSFLGFGVPPPTPSIGELLEQAKQHFEYAWWLAVYPGALLFVTLTLLNFIGEGLRDAMDPFAKKF